MKNFEITVPVGQTREAHNVVAYYGNINECLIPVASNAWETNLEESFWAQALEAQTFDDEEEAEGDFLETLKEAFTLAGVTDYKIEEIQK